MQSADKKVMTDVLFQIAIRASQGARRAQEDTALCWPSGTTGADAAMLSQMPIEEPGRVAAVLCDGMGGHFGGATASRVACESFLPDLVSAEGSARQRLMHALKQANASITRHVDESPSLDGMGSTLVGVEAGADGLWWVSVGDSLLYLWRDGEIALLNEDHSLAPEIDKLAETGKISWTAARADPRRHYLRSALTGGDIDDIEMIDLSERAAPLQEGDVIVLASDGVNTLEPASIASIVAQCAHSSAATIAARLISNVDAARQPHQDNTTVVAIRVLSQSAAADV